MNVKVEIICIGNELLIGKTLNTNAHWLAKRATSSGADVSRVTVVKDDLSEIATALREALSRRPRFIITTGGLGPTFDDKTLEGIAKGLNRKLEANNEALKMVREKYETLLKQKKIDKIEMTPSRVKMATFPRRTHALHNPVGTAPGMVADVEQTSVIALPGVPPEMEAIFDESVAPMLKKEAGESAFFEASIYVGGVMESSLAPLIDRVMHDNPSVYLKSHVYTKSRPQVEGKSSHIELHFSTTNDDFLAAKKSLNKAMVQMSELVQENGGTTSIAETSQD
jgi:molybdenum cofactor synthesis domain-containing protein